MKTAALYATACLVILASAGRAGWVHPKDVEIVRTPYALVLRPGVGIELRVGNRVVVHGSRIMLRADGNKTSHYIASRSKTAIIRVEDKRKMGTITIVDGGDSGPLRYECRLSLSDDGLFTYRFRGRCHDFPNAVLQQDFMLHPSTFAGADFVADGAGGSKTGQIPPSPLPFKHRTILSGQFERCVFRTRLGRIEAHGSCQINDFRSVKWLKEPGLLYYTSAPVKSGDQPQADIRLQLPAVSTAEATESLALPSGQARTIEIPVPPGTPHAYWALQVESCLPHAIAGPEGIGGALGAGDLTSPSPGVVRWIQGSPFRTGNRCLVLHGWLDVQCRYPRNVTGIEINRRAQRLCFLQGCSGPVGVDAHAVRYVVHYEDGTTSEAIVTGTETGGVLSRSAAGPARAILAVAPSGTVLSAYIFGWTNPHPEKTIASIDVHSTDASHSPILFALTGALPHKR